MDDLPINTQAIIFIVIAVIGFLQSVFKGAKKKAPDEMERRPMDEYRRAVEEARRAAQERTQPATPVPDQPELAQPVVQEQPVVQARPIEAKPVLVRSIPAPPAVREPTRQPVERTVKVSKPVIAKVKKPNKGSVKTLLSSPAAAKKAIILTEILGKPKALR